MFVFVDVINREFGTLLNNAYPFQLYFVARDGIHTDTDCKLRWMGFVVVVVLFVVKLFTWQSY